MSLAVASAQIACVRALQTAGVSFKVFDSLVDPRSLATEPQVIAVVSITDGRIKMNGKSFFDTEHDVDLCIDLAIARQVKVELQEGEGEDAQTILVDFPDNGSGHDLVLRTAAWELFATLQAQNNVWAELFREIIFSRDEEAPATWERGVSADKGMRLGILRYTFKLCLFDDPSPNEAPEEDGFWFRMLAAMETDPELADIGKLWRKMITGEAVPEWRQVQAAMGLTVTDMRSLGLAPAVSDGNDAVPAATEIAIDDADNETSIEVDADGATFVDGIAETPIVEEDEE